MKMAAIVLFFSFSVFAQDIECVRYYESTCLFCPSPNFLPYEGNGRCVDWSHIMISLHAVDQNFQSLDTSIKFEINDEEINAEFNYKGLYSLETIPEPIYSIDKDENYAVYKHESAEEILLISRDVINDEVEYAKAMFRGATYLCRKKIL